MDIKSNLLAILLVICILTTGCMSDLAAPPTHERTELIGSSWRLVSYNSGDLGMVVVSPRTNITLKFSEDGNVSNFIDNCIIYSGRYTNRGETISVTNLAEINKSACPLSQETAGMINTYISLLQKSPRFNFEENKLIFGYFDAQKYLVFTRI